MNGFKLYLLLLTMLYFSSNVLVAQNNTNNWQIYAHNDMSFEMPGDALMVDSLKTTLFSFEIDSFLSLQTHIFSDARFNLNEAVFAEAFAQEDSNYLRAMAKIMLLATNSEVTEIMEVSNNGINGLQLGIRYLSLAADRPFYTFMQYFLHNNQFYAFSVTTTENDLRSQAYKQYFFQSINFD